MKSIENYIYSHVIEKILAAINSAKGNEVFFIGKTDSNLIVEDVAVIARGNENAVPVVKEHAARSDVVIHNHPSGNLTPSHNDLLIAHEFATFGVASYIVNNQVNDIYVIIEPFEKDDSKSIDIGQIRKTLSPGSSVSAHLANYEYRPQQIDMIQKIAEAFNEKKIGIIEAGTGVGKSLAYLIPAAYWSTMNNERIVVSTNTINLQEQLINKDIPFLQRVLGFEFKATLVKGRGNYVCLRKLYSLVSDQEEMFQSKEKDELKIILEWAKTTNDGSKSDINFIPSESVWEHIASESDSCMWSNCNYFGNCFVTKARRRANNAQLLVVNHHLLFSDLAVQALGTGVAVLPSYKHIIFDEAHNIEAVATDYFGAGITRAGISRILKRLHHKSDKANVGYLNILSKKLAIKNNQYQIAEFAKIIDQINNEIIGQIETILEFNDDIMNTINELVCGVYGDDFELKARITPMLKRNQIWNQHVVPQIKNFSKLLNRLHYSLSDILERIEKVNIQFDPIFLSNKIEVDTQRRRLKGIADVLEQIVIEEDVKNIRWIEVVKRKTSNNIVRLRKAPLNISQQMNELIYDNYKTIILTSATLTIAGLKNHDEFNYLFKQIGLNLVSRDRLITAKIPTPFDFKSQVITIIPDDIPSPDSSGFADKLVEVVFEALMISRGRAFVLFTSYGLLNKIYKALAPRLGKEGIQCYYQGQMARHQMLQMFKKDTSSVLFGTDSFWQGVDVEGEALESVIITKLPFKVPSEPIIEARVEEIERQGGNAFMEYSVPQAVIKLKQGFGRLIRKKTDKGSVFILDQRIVKKFYGKIFLNSLPKSQIATGPQKVVFEKARLFFNSFKN